VTGFGGVHEKGRGSGAGEGRGDLAGDVPGFAHAADHHAAVAFEAQTARPRESDADPGGEGAERPLLDAQGTARGSDQRVIVGTGGGRYTGRMHFHARHYRRPHAAPM
jgi:hypothetical protein